MNLIRKGHGHAHRGVIGVESAIVMIAFVIVAAALAFVVLNMGFATTQKAKTTIISGLNEASSSIEVAGKITGIGCLPNSSDPACTTTQRMNATAIPIKVASGGDSVDLSTSTAAVKYLSNSVEYTDIFECTLISNTYKNLTLAFRAAQYDSNCSSFSIAGHNHPIANSTTATTAAIVYWSVTATPQNSILDQGEHANLAIAYAPGDRPAALDKIRAEILLPIGAPLTVERQIPSITNIVVDLG